MGNGFSCTVHTRQSQACLAEETMDGKVRRVALSLGITAALIISLVLILVFLQYRGRLTKPAPQETSSPVDATKPSKPEKDGQQVVSMVTKEELLAAWEKEKLPVWGVEIEPIACGTYRYLFYLDETRIADPLNPPLGIDQETSFFTWPPEQSSSAPAESGGTVPFVLGDSRALFIYRGEIQRALHFISPFRGGWWGIDELQPLNEAARANLERARNDQFLSVVNGIVIDPSGRPIPEARVRLSGTTDLMVRVGDSKHVRTVECNDKGLFLMERLPYKTYLWLTARAAGYCETRLKLSGRDLDKQNVPFYEIILNPTQLAGGIVVDEESNPLGGAVVQARPKGEYRSLAATESAYGTGRFEFNSLPPGVYVFCAEKPGYVFSLCPDIVIGDGVNGKEHTGIRLVLQKGITLTGRVVWDQAPEGETRGVEGAKIVFAGLLAYEAGGWVPYISSELTATSDAEGRFTIKGIAAGTRYEASVRYGFMEAEEKPDIFIRDGMKPEPLLFHMPSERSLEGCIIDEEGLPIQDATVQVAGLQSAVSRKVQWVKTIPPKRVSTDEQGRFIIKHFKSGMRCSVRVDADGYNSREVDNLVVDSETHIEIILQKGIRLTGRVIDAATGMPLDGFVVYHHHSFVTEKTVSSVDGTFSFTNRKPGRQLLSGQGEAGGRSFVARLLIDISPPKDQHETAVVLEAMEAAEVRGIVRRAGTDAPVAEAVVSGRANSVLTDKNGAFALDKLFPGENALSAKDPLSKEPPPYGKASKRLELKPGELREGVDLDIPRTGTISGVVLHEDGRPARVISLCIGSERARRNGLNIIRLKSGGNGEFFQDGLPLKDEDDQEALSVEVCTDSMCPWFGESGQVLLTPENPHAEVTVQLHEGGSIEGKVMDSEGIPIVNHSLWLYTIPGRWGCFTRVRSGRNGRYIFQGLPPDEYSINTTRRNKYKYPKLPSKIQVTAGQRVELDIILEESVEKTARNTFRGMLMDSNIQPLHGWTIRSRSETTGTPFTVTTGHDGSFMIRTYEDCGHTLELFDYMADRLKSRERGLCKITGIRPVEENSSEAKEVFEIVVPIGATLKGRLVYEDSGEPVSEVVVMLRAAPDWKKPPLQDGVCVPARLSVRRPVVTEKDNGCFTMSGLVLGTYSLIITSSTTEKKSIKTITLDEARTKDLGDISLVKKQE